VIERAQRFRDRLRETVGSIEKDGGEDQQGQRKNIVVVTHGVFMKFLAEDETIDLPKAGWKAFRVDGREDGGAVLVPLK